MTMDNSEHTLDCLCAWCEVERQHAEQRAAKEQAEARRSAAACSEPQWTPRAKKMLILARKVALKYGHNYIGSEHMLGGMIVEGEALASRLLAAHGVTMELLIRECGWQVKTDPTEEERERAEYQRLHAKFGAQNVQGMAAGADGPPMPGD